MFDFQQRQRAFARAIRYGAPLDYPLEIPVSRMALYQKNFLANIEAILSNCFPILSTILEEKVWYRFVEHFYAIHVSKSPLFSDIPEAFLSYLFETKNKPLELPVLLALAHFEWMEMAMDFLEGDAAPPTQGRVDMENQILAVSEVAEIVAYRFPVHKINRDYIPILKDYPATYLCVYRNSLGTVYFIELTLLGARLLQQLKRVPGAGQPLLVKWGQSLNVAARERLMEEGIKALTEFLQLGIVYPECCSAPAQKCADRVADVRKMAWTVYPKVGIANVKGI